MYTLHFSNESHNNANFIIFQQYPNQSQEMHSLAWNSKNIRPQSQYRAQWEIDYYFVWGETSQLRPGVNFMSSQSIPASPDELNEVSFSCRSGFTEFANLHSSHPKGELVINEDYSVPSDRYAIGIGLSGNPACVIQAMPNMRVQFSSSPKYYAAIGNFRQGDVLDMAALQPIQLDFPQNRSLKVTLEASGMLKVEQD